ncbi:MAG: Homoserine kinase [Alphaproteobacteria bacterium MarineAlpha6_Bin4]|nr:MAG: Homoserine kinase [Alphaproteobacteria bacterium MarineAlpha6_Bin3]PPR38086.1 MAG: Homoserine kinase [Alphaproteobacteria bacterium MarineAlpha6_Bin4]
MAYYTKITKKEFQKYIQNYSIGELSYFEGIDEGIENTNYFFKTKAQKYVLTIYENKITERIKQKNLSFFIELINFLRKKNFPTPKIISNNKNKQLNTYKKKQFSIVEFIDGKITKKINNQHCYKLGKILATLHKKTLGFKNKRKNDFSLKEWHALTKRIKLSKKGALFLKEEINYIKKNWPKNLPMGIIHGDLFPDNVFFKNNNIVGVIDLSNACNDFFCYDLSICINAWCYKKNLDINKMKNLIKGYNSVRKLENNEIRNINFFLRVSSLRFYLSRLMDLQNKKIPKKYKKNPKDYLRKLKYFQSNNLKNIFK